MSSNSAPKDEPASGSEFADTNYYQKLYYHRLGTAQAEDKLICHRPDEKEWGFNAGVTDDGRYLIIRVWRGTESKNLVFYQDLSQKDGAVIELINEFKDSYGFIDNEGSLFWFTTYLDAQIMQRSFRFYMLIRPCITLNLALNTPLL